MEGAFDATVFADQIALDLGLQIGQVIATLLSTSRRSTSTYSVQITFASSVPNPEDYAATILDWPNTSAGQAYMSSLGITGVSAPSNVPPSEPKKNLPVIAGAIAGGIIVVAALIFIIYRHKKNQRVDQDYVAMQNVKGNGV
jgi:hypothetical protein